MIFWLLLSDNVYSMVTIIFTIQYNQVQKKVLSEFYWVTLYNISINYFYVN
jgi:ubiquinone/menaquinone biosynthesis C-methylase UbiE